MLCCNAAIRINVIEVGTNFFRILLYKESNFREADEEKKKREYIESFCDSF